jgi:hypothetical protein
VESQWGVTQTGQGTGHARRSTLVIDPGWLSLDPPADCSRWKKRDRVAGLHRHCNQLTWRKTCAASTTRQRHTHGNYDCRPTENGCRPKPPHTGTLVDFHLLSLADSSGMSSALRPDGIVFGLLETKARHDTAFGNIRNLKSGAGGEPGPLPSKRAGRLIMNHLRPVCGLDS